MENNFYSKGYYDLINRKLEVLSGYKNILHLSQNGIYGKDILEMLDHIDGFCDSLDYTAKSDYPNLRPKRKYLLVLDGASRTYFFIRQRRIR